MKKFKVALWVLIFALIALVIYQNKHFFLEKPNLSVDLFFTQYQTSELYNAIIFLGCFLIGILISYFFSLSGRFKANKIIKNLSVTVDSQVQKISELTRQIETLKGGDAMASGNAGGVGAAEVVEEPPQS
jgi:uncharacterized integral membrane protein